MYTAAIGAIAMLGGYKPASPWDSITDIPALRVLGWVLFCLLPSVLSVIGVYFLITLPLRRQERARVLIDVLAAGVRRGQAPAVTLTALAERRVLGWELWRAARAVGAGEPMSRALRTSAPSLLPPNITGALAAGEAMGDVGRVLPACRRMLVDAVPRTRAALNYLPLMTISLFLMPMVFMRFFLVPKLQEIVRSMALPSMHAGDALTAFSHPAIAWFCVAAPLALAATAVLYIGGPRLAESIGWDRLIGDRLAMRLPWRRGHGVVTSRTMREAPGSTAGTHSTRADGRATVTTTSPGGRLSAAAATT